jgi:hypothetical protein
MLVAGPAAGAVGGYTKNATYEGIKAAGGGYSITPAALNKDVGTNALFGVIPGLADLPGVGRALGLAGRDSLSSLAKALVTKLDRGIISNVSAASTLKMVFYSAFQQVLGSSAQSTYNTMPSSANSQKKTPDPIIPSSSGGGYGSPGTTYTSFYAPNTFSACGTLCR